jgi:biopolymer transport protein ExbB
MIEAVINYWHTGGFLMAILALLCYAIWFRFFRVRGALRAVVGATPSFERDLMHNLSHRSLQENRSAYAGNPDPLSQVTASVLRAVEQRQSPGQAFDQMETARMNAFQRETRLLAAGTAAAPLLGLLGTVIGMVATFDAVSGEGGHTATQVSSGISQALISTQCGLVVAIPGLFGLAYLGRLRERARVRLGECRTHLVYLLERGERP